MAYWLPSSENSKFEQYVHSKLHTCFITTCKGVVKGGGASEGSTPPPPKFPIFFKSEGKEVERKKMKGMGGGLRLNVNIFFGVMSFSSGVEKFSGGGLRNFPERVEKFSWGCEISGGFRFFREGLGNFLEGL